MNVRTKAIGGAVVFAAIALIFAYPVFAAATTANLSNATDAPYTAVSLTRTGALPLTPATASGQLVPSANINSIRVPPNVTVGQTITLTSSSGQWRIINSPTALHVSSGVASGTLTLTVTGAFSRGYALSITAGTLVINGTTYTMASGNAEMGPWLAHMVGQGSFTSAAPGSFLMAGAAHGDFLGNTHNVLRFDVQANSVEYGVALLVTTVSS